MAKPLPMADSTGALRWNTPDSLAPRALERLDVDLSNASFALRNGLHNFSGNIFGLVIGLLIVARVSAWAARPGRWWALMLLIVFGPVYFTDSNIPVALAVALVVYFIYRKKSPPAAAPTHPWYWPFASAVVWVAVFWFMRFPLFYAFQLIRPGDYSSDYKLTLALLPMVALVGGVFGLLFTPTVVLFGRSLDTLLGMLEFVGVSVGDVFAVRGFSNRLWALVPVVFAAAVGVAIWQAVRLLWSSTP